MHAIDHIGDGILGRGEEKLCAARGLGVLHAQGEKFAVFTERGGFPGGGSQQTFPIIQPHHIARTLAGASSLAGVSGWMPSRCSTSAR